MAVNLIPPHPFLRLGLTMKKPAHRGAMEISQQRPRHLAPVAEDQLQLLGARDPQHAISGVQWAAPVDDTSAKSSSIFCATASASSKSLQRREGRVGDLRHSPCRARWARAPSATPSGPPWRVVKR